MIFNKYREKYYTIILGAQSENRSKCNIYFENHHIIPKSMGGSDGVDNMVLLTPEEHFKVHILLPYFTEGTARDKMIYAWNMMSNRNGVPIDYEEYNILREEHSKVHSDAMSGKKNPMYGKCHTEETKHKISKLNSGKNHGLFGKHHSKETRKMLSEAHTGKTMSEESKMKNSKAHKGKIASTETRKRMAESHKGKRHSEETKRKQSEAHMGIPHQIVECPNCGKSGGCRNMKRYHFDNCKKRIKNVYL